jgi:hypothetical protein
LVLGGGSSGWLERLHGKEIPQEQWDEFVRAGREQRALIHQNAHPQVPAYDRNMTPAQFAEYLEKYIASQPQ